MTAENPEVTLDRLVRARYPVIVIVSHEETRVMECIKRVAGTKRAVSPWSFTRGLQNMPTTDPEMTADPAAALDIIANFDESNSEQPRLFVMKDLHNMLSDAKVIRYVRDVAARFEERSHTMILLSPNFKVPADLEKTVVVLDWPLPDVKQLEGILDRAEAEFPRDVKRSLNGDRAEVIRAMQGLTLYEAENVLKSAVVATRELGKNVIPFIVEEKAQIIKKSGVLEYYPATVKMSDVGGLNELKEYAAIKRAAFSDDARQRGVDAPKGLLMVGVPGTGKSLSAKAIAGGQMPLLRMDVGALMGGLVGQSEGNMRSALKVAEAVAPCVLWVDEIEKALGGMGGETDGGTSMRVLGTLLTWMQETRSPVYVVATANDVRGLRPELLRRFDDLVFVDLPDAASRDEILKVHLTKRGQSVDDLNDIVKATWGFSGAELEKVVKSAIERAYFQKQALTAEMLLSAAGKIVPISETMKEQIDNVRAWAKTRAIPAGPTLEPKPEANGRRKASLEI